ncbi:MAG: hypothetical protein J0M11_11810 [Anaerolineae bacterium]|nr:hypothetical protein [Anaerolineae bacterium]
MQSQDEKIKVKALTNKVFRWVMATGTLASIILFSASYLLPVSSPIQDALKETGVIVIGVVIVSLIQVLVLDEFYKQQSREAISPDLESVEARVVEEFRRVIPEVKAETVGAIDDIRARVSEATDFMLKGIDVLSGAKSAGIANIFPTRYEKISGKSVVEVIQDDLQAENSQIRLMGISLGDYFLDRGVLHSSFIKLLESSSHQLTKPTIRALLVHPKCETLRERARWEAGSEYYQEPAFFDSTTYIETDGAVRIAKRLCEKYGTLLEIRLYRQAPTAFVLLTSRFAFVEAYNYAARGSNVPVFQVQAGVSLYRHYESHFERIWTVSDSIGTYNPFSSIDLKKDGRLTV